MYTEMKVIIELVLIIIVAAIFHEFGHYGMAGVLGLHPRFAWRNGDPCVVVLHKRSKARREGFYIILSGLISGYLVALILLNMNFYTGNAIYVVVGYIFVCRHDCLQVIVDLLRLERVG